MLDLKQNMTGAAKTPSCKGLETITPLATNATELRVEEAASICQRIICQSITQTPFCKSGQVWQNFEKNSMLFSLPMRHEAKLLRQNEYD